MLRIAVIVAMVLFSMDNVWGQGGTIELDDNLVNLSVGFGNTMYSGPNYTSGVPPLALSYERAIADRLIEGKGVASVMAYLGYTSYTFDYLGWGYRYANVILGAGGIFHYPVIDRLDTYAGLLLGYNLVNATEFGQSSGWDYAVVNNNLVFSGFIGVRYFFIDQLAAFAQLGYGIAYLNLGVSLCF